MSKFRNFTTLGELAELNSESLNAETPGNYSFKYIDLSAVSCGTVDIASLKSIRFADAPSRARRVVQDGDILFGTVRPQLRSHARISGDGFVASTGFCVVRPRPGVADSDFLGHYLLSDGVSQQAACQEEGSNYPAVTEQDIAAFSLPRFSLEEQRQIAEVLDAVDQTIQTTERVVAKLVKIREGLRRSQFADLVSSSRLHPISECFDMTLGKMLSPAARTGVSPAPYLANRNVQWERCSLDNLDQMDFTQSERVKFSLEPGDVLVCEGGEVGRTAIWYGELDTCFFQKAIHRLRTRGQVMPEFMLHYMKYAAELDLFKMHTSQTSIAHLTGEQLARLPVPVPSKDVQITVVSALVDLSRQIEAESAELQKVSRIRSGLATDLLSGRVRTVAA